MAEPIEYIDPLSFRSIDSMPILGTSPDLLDLDRVRYHIFRAVEKNRYKGAVEPIEYLLAKRCIVENNDDYLVTPAGLLCFGRNPQKILPHAIVNIVHYRGAAPDSTQAIHIERGISGTIFDQLQRIEEYLGRNNRRGMTIQPGSFERIPVDEYPDVVLRELSVNMVAHRDYKDIQSAAQLQLFNNRITWTNPGGLPDGITIDQILHTQRSRNPVLFSILWENGLIEGVGQGLDTVVAVLAREGMRAPEFEDINHAFFVATVAGKPVDVLDLYTNLTERQRRIVVVIRARADVSTNDIAASLGVTQRSIQRDIRTLLELGIIQSNGYSTATRYRLAPQPC